MNINVLNSDDLMLLCGRLQRVWSGQWGSCWWRVMSWSFIADRQRPHIVNRSHLATGHHQRRCLPTTRTDSL